MKTKGYQNKDLLRILLLLFLILSISFFNNLKAQHKIKRVKHTNGSVSQPDIVAMEYYIDTDPGFGNGTSIAISSDTNITTNLNIDVSSLTSGIHVVGVRSLDANGVWSLSGKYQFLKPSSVDTLQAAPSLKLTEYYIDTDPGYGNGTPISITAGDSAVANVAIPVGSYYNSTTHTCYIRSRDSTGAWSLDDSFSFTKTPDTTRSTTYANTCFGNSYTFNGNIYNAPLTLSDTIYHSDTLVNSNGGDSIASLVLTGDNLYYTPKVVISSSATSVTPGSYVTFTAYPYYGGTSPLYNWYKNGILEVSFSPSNTYTDYSPINGDSVYCIMFSSASCYTKDTSQSGGIVTSVSTQDLHIYNFSPHIASSGTLIKIIGIGFQTRPVTQVIIGGQPALNYSVLSDTSIVATVAQAKNGSIVVMNALNSDSAIGFIYNSPMVTNYQIGIIQNFGGTGMAGYTGDDGPAIDATYNHPSSVRMDYGCKRLFIADTYNNVIREIYKASVVGDSLVSTHNHKTTFSSKPPQSGTPSKPPPSTGSGGGAATGQGTGKTNLLPTDSLLIPSGCSLFASSSDLNCVFATNPSQTFYIMAGSKTGVAGFAGDNGIDSNALFNHPAGIVSSRDSTILFIADELNNRIRRIDLNTHVITTYAGNGVADFGGDGGLATDAALNRPHSIDIDTAGNLYIADTYNNRIRKVDAHGIINTVVGTGVADFTDATAKGLATSLNLPMDVSVSPNGYVFIADTYNNRVRVLAQDGNVYTLSGLDNDTTHGYYGDGIQSNLGRLNMPTGVTWDTSGGGLAVYVADANNNMIRQITFGSIIPNNIWTGAVSKDWQDLRNWSNGVLPTTTGIITIPYGQPNNPMLTKTTIIDTLILQGNLDLNGQVLTLNGNVSGIGQFASDKGSWLVINGNVDTLNFVDSHHTVANLTINGNVNIGNSLDITGFLYPNAGSLTLGNNDITLKSLDIGTSAQVGLVGSTINYGGRGRFIAERLLNNPRRGYRNISSNGILSDSAIFNNWQENGASIAGYGTQITGLSRNSPGFDSMTGLDYTKTGSPSLFTYNTADAFVPITNTKAPALNQLLPFVGYYALIRGDRTYNLYSNGPDLYAASTTLRTRGKLLYGPVQLSSNENPIWAFGDSVQSTFKLNNNVAPVGQNIYDYGFSLIANPYNCTVDWGSIYIRSSLFSNNHLSMYYWVWNQALNNGLGAYITVDNTGIASTYTGSPLTTNTNWIQPGQSFFVQNDNTGADIVVDFEETDKYVADSSKLVGVFGASQANMMRFSLNKKSGRDTIIVDGAVLKVDPSYSNAINKDDAGKFVNPAENISIHRNGLDISMESRRLPTVMDTIPLQIWNVAKDSSYILAVDASQFYSPLQPKLYDKLLGTKATLSTTSPNNIAFNVTNDTLGYKHRFGIVFEQPIALPISFSLVDAQHGVAGNLVKWEATCGDGAVRYVVERSIDGSNFEKVGEVPAKLGGCLQSYSFTDVKTMEGVVYYRLEMVGNSSSLYSQMVKLVINGNSRVSIYPTILKDNSITVGLGDMPKGVYQVALFDTKGDLLNKQVIEHGGGTSKYNVLVGNMKLPVGVYEMRVLRGSESVFLQKIVVVP